MNHRKLAHQLGRGIVQGMVLAGLLWSCTACSGSESGSQTSAPLQSVRVSLEVEQKESHAQAHNKTPPSESLTTSEHGLQTIESLFPTLYRDFSYICAFGIYYEFGMQAIDLHSLHFRSLSVRDYFSTVSQSEQFPYRNNVYILKALTEQELLDVYNRFEASTITLDTMRSLIQYSGDQVQPGTQNPEFGRMPPFLALDEEYTPTLKLEYVQKYLLEQEDHEKILYFQRNRTYAYLSVVSIGGITHLALETPEQGNWKVIGQNIYLPITFLHPGKPRETQPEIVCWCRLKPNNKEYDVPKKSPYFLDGLLSLEEFEKILSTH